MTVDTIFVERLTAWMARIASGAILGLAIWCLSKLHHHDVQLAVVSYRLTQIEASQARTEEKVDFIWTRVGGRTERERQD